MDKKESYLQKLFEKREKVQASVPSLSPQKDLTDLLEEIVIAFPPGCFCPPPQQTITQIKNALNDLLIWSTSAPISNSLKLELQNAINAVKNQLDTNPFSCCDTIQALQAFVFVLIKVIDQPLVGIPFKVHLQNLTQQLQALFSSYIACLACEPGPTGSTGPGKAAYVTNNGDNTVSIVDLTTNSIAGSISGFSVPLGITLTPDGLTAYV
ncbi:YncE family protein, partial [Bacillus toyonensis]|uniref:YncE family protein n=1 Tax=Bacillus toyonensis TaxID=155322 RepID=UPI000BFAF3E5